MRWHVVYKFYFRRATATYFSAGAVTSQCILFVFPLCFCSENYPALLETSFLAVLGCQTQTKLALQQAEFHLTSSTNQNSRLQTWNWLSPPPILRYRYIPINPDVCVAMLFCAHYLPILAQVVV